MLLPLRSQVILASHLLPPLIVTIYTCVSIHTSLSALAIEAMTFLAQSAYLTKGFVEHLAHFWSWIRTWFWFSVQPVGSTVKAKKEKEKRKTKKAQRSLPKYSYMQKAVSSQWMFSCKSNNGNVTEIWLPNLTVLFRTGNQANLPTAVHFFTVTRFPQYDKIRSVRAWRALLTFN